MKILTKKSSIPNNFIAASQKHFSGYASAHIHEFFEIEYILKGSGICEIDGKIYPFKEGALFLLNPSNTHALRSSDADLINVMFRCESSGDMLPLPILYSASCPLFQLSEGEKTLIFTLLSELVAIYEEDIRYARLLLECILTKLSQQSDAKSRAPLPYIQNAFLYITEHFRDGITLDSTAAHLGLTPTYFSDLFKKETGTTFKGYLDRVRFSHAENLLIFTEIPVCEIPRCSGFYDYANFSRRFRERFGMSPLAYRRKNAT